MTMFATYKLARSRRVLVSALLVVVVSLLFAASASAADGLSPWWHISSGAVPTYLPPGGEGEIVVNLTDVGDAQAEGSVSPIVISDVLPAGLIAKEITGRTRNGNTGVPISCDLAELTCEDTAGVVPYALVEVLIKVGVEEGLQSGGLNRVSVAGGGAAAPVAISRPVLVGESTPFGVEENVLSVEGPNGAPVTQAGSHPFQTTSTIVLNKQVGDAEVKRLGGGETVGQAKDLGVALPAGFVGDPQVVPSCTLGQFLTPASGAFANECSPQTALGIAQVHIIVPNTIGDTVFAVPVFNLEPAAGEPARFGFYIPLARAPVILDTALRSGPGEDYGIDVISHNIVQTADLISVQVTLWGTPGDARHNSLRGWGCLGKAQGVQELPCTPLEEEKPTPFQTLPTSCSGAPLQAHVLADSWAAPADLQTLPTTEPMSTLDGCNRLPFAPTIEASPSTTDASAPSGLDFNLNFDDEGLLSEEGIAQSHLEDTSVTLPEGMTINPSAGVGLVGCTEADYARETLESLPGAGCPNEAKLGTVEIQTPLLTTAIHGSLYIAEPYENPFGSLVALYIVAKNPETGVMIKLAGKVTPNPVTGQLVTTFENNPQLPFSHFNFHFREGQQAPLITPSLCGAYTTQALLTPWSEPTASLTGDSSFILTHNYQGGNCPSGGVPPFTPGIEAGTLNDNAGSFSPFYLHLTRTDGEQYISGFSTDLPSGLTGDLTGIPFCPEADIEAARHETGAQEEANPSCPVASQVGHTLVGTGVGAVLAYVPGKIYLGGPFDGAPFSIVSVTSAVVGPFDLGTVVLRFGLEINPYTAQVSVSPTSSEPIPTIIDGIVTHVRDIRVYIERPGNAPFTLNPTSCNPLAISSTLNSNYGQSATVTSPFQAASCANLKFEPKFAVSTSGKTSKAQGASLHVNLTYPQAPQGTYANISKVKVELPKQLPSRLTTLQKACIAAQFEANPAGCPTPSIIGQAKAVVPNIPEPLTGPVYFVSHGGEAFPSLEIVLQGYGVKVILVGTTFISKSGITSTTFKTVPDNPVTSFELTLPEGPYSALAANGNLCTQKLTMPSDFTGQNGAEIDYKTPVSVTGCPKAKTLTRTQKLAKALKACKKDKKKSKRQKCEKTARKKYGPIAKKKKTKK